MKRQGPPAWADLWLDALATAGWGAGLKRGAAYSREGAVTDLLVRPGQAGASVQDPDGSVAQPRLAVRPLSTPEWVTVAVAILRDPSLAAAVAGGTWPPAAAAVLAEAGVPLLPAAVDLAADCACGARPPCRHVAALCYLFAESLNADPWLLPLLRGRSLAALERLLAEARAALVPAAEDAGPEVADPGAPAGAPAAPPPAAPVVPEAPAGMAPSSFWDLAGDLGDINCPIAAPAQVAPLLRQLGPPPFWHPPAAFAAHLEPVYTAVTAAMLRLAQGDADADGADSAPPPRAPAP